MCTHNLHRSLSRQENSQMSNDLSNANLVLTRQSRYCLAVALEMDCTRQSKSIGDAVKSLGGSDNHREMPATVWVQEVGKNCSGNGGRLCAMTIASYSIAVKF